MLNEGDYYLLSGNVRLRRESFGGIAFDTKTGLTMELDREAFSLLWMARQGIPVNAPVLHGNHETARAGVASIMKQFLQRGVIQRQVKRDEMIPVCDDQASGLDASGPRPVWPETGRLVAPETVHWAVTYRCPSNCPDCYTARFPGEFQMEMTTAAAFQMLDTLAAWGVFQLAMGGGEPLVREDLPQLAARARENGMVVHVTTGLERIAPPLLRRLAGEVRSLHFGLRDERLLGSPRTEISRLSDLLKATADLGLFCGVNLILSNTVIRNFTTICELIAQTGISRLILLRYKPPAEIGRWIKQNPTPQTLRRFETVLAQTVRNFPELDIRVDCGLSFLQRFLAPDKASAAGIKGCAAAERILALTPDGSIFPCSQLIHSECRIGNILTDPVRELWARSPRLRSYRHFREKGGFEETACGICKAKYQCGGCRVFADDFWGADPGCPGPVYPEPPRLGKAGRKLDLKEYCQKHGGISVAQYMERYGVGQERAVRELKDTPGLRNSDPRSTGRRLTAYYGYAAADHELLLDIQESIGFTSGGAPFATLDEIADWVTDEAGDETGHAYPRWILKGRLSDREDY